MTNIETQLADTRRALRNWRWLAAICVMLTAVVVTLAGIPYAMG